jgi:hypothetical protein
MIMCQGDFSQDAKILTLLHRTLGVSKKRLDLFCLRLVMLLAILVSHTVALLYLI